MENKMNWGTLILGIVVGVVVVGIIWFTSKPAETEGAREVRECIQRGIVGPEVVTVGGGGCVQQLQSGFTIEDFNMASCVNDVLETCLRR